MKARDSLAKILNCDPSGPDFEEFAVQINVAPMRSKQGLIHLSVFPIDEVLSKIQTDETKIEFLVDDVPYSVKMNSDRYVVFRNSRVCACCGLEGTKMILDVNPGNSNAHFNLYAVENDRLVLMTKDHTIPKSKGGRDELSNYSTMCCVCNNLKGDCDLTLDECRQLRDLYKNKAKLPRKELRTLINSYRRELSLKKQEQP
jgi:hypothetical protein